MSGSAAVPFTPEQQAAIAHPGGLLLTANAGSGKTSVMAERYVRIARGGDPDDDVGRILAITFTEKAAAELKARVRARFEALGDGERARATEGAWISTIHGFCARLLRTHALAAGLDPRFAVLDERVARRLAADAFATALEDLVHAHGDAALELIAAYRPADLRDALVALHGELRSRGHEHPQLPPARPADLQAAHSALALARAQAAVVLAEANDGKTVERARERLAACAALLDRPLGPPPAPETVDALALRGNGVALNDPACEAYAAALTAFADACADAAALPTHALLDALLQAFARRYADAKQAASALDFEDLELRANRLLREHEPLRARYAERFRHVMVDEFQDTNPLQLELLERIAGDELFAVGDELQSIYGFRHADVRLFRARRARLAERGATATLATNFRSHGDLLHAFNIAFAPRFDASFTPLRAGRAEPEDGADAAAPRVELLVVDRSADWAGAGLVAPGAVPPAPLWRLAEARLLAARVRELIDAGTPPGEIVLLLRATGDLAVYERALVERGVPTYVIGGRGYWSQQQVRDLVAYLSVLANPRDGVALYTLLASPLVGLASDGLVQLAAAARAAERDPWWTLIDDDALLERLDAGDRARVEALRAWLPAERRTAPRHSLEGLLDRVLARTGYDRVLLRMEGGARRMANVRKLMRLAREHEAQHGRGLRGFADLVSGLVGGADASGDERESEAPVEGEALDAVRVMTIHRAKGLEFPVVCVADLGRESPAAGRELVRVGDDGRVGLRLRRLGGARPRDAFAYRALVEQAKRRDAEEEARLFYVAVTRARERLILSGAATCDPWPEAKPGAPPIAWLGPAFVPDLARRCAPDATARTVAEHDDIAVAVTVARPDLLAELPAPSPGDQAALRAGPVGSEPTHPGAHPGLATGARASSPTTGSAGGAAARSASPAALAPPVAALSYTSLAQHAQCGYRFYLERVLGLPPTDEARYGSARRPPAELDPRVRGRIVHALLEQLDFKRPQAPDAEAVRAEAHRAGVTLTDRTADELARLVAGLLASDVARRLAALRDLRREQPFALQLAHVPLVGVFDAVGRERDRTLVVDYKSDRLDPEADPEQLVAADYALQRAAYALAALRDGARTAEVVHVFLERAHEPAAATYTDADLPALAAELEQRAGAVLRREFPVAPQPGPRVCDGCPGRGSLCSWPLEATLDVPEGRLF
ncbi:MAG: UvrD-helicase domain-containing protein [Actinobacteria bacterium]|nr:UvrD-helicase domain-containing protein [Actinomycetota bacterium]